MRPVITGCLALWAILMLLESGTSAEELRYHPDGVLGRPSLHITGQYSSVTALKGAAYVDRQYLGVGFRIPVIGQLTVGGNYCALIEDSVVHSYGFKFSYYAANPLIDRGKTNPDGPVGSPVLLALAGGYFPDRNPGKQRFLAGLEAIYPLTPRLSFAVGGKYYEEDSPRLVDNFYGRLAWYLKSYEIETIYSNPDGPEGAPSFLITGGGSKHGVFGQFDVIFPLEPKMTLALYIRGERVPVPYFRAASAGFYVNYYPGDRN